MRLACPVDDTAVRPKVRKAQRVSWQQDIRSASCKRHHTTTVHQSNSCKSPSYYNRLQVNQMRDTLYYNRCYQIGTPQHRGKLAALFTSCLPFSLRSATVRKTGYISEKILAAATVVTFVSCDVKSAGNI
jgi:hypothetical protein